jgi:ABC-2 type transport system ATP-binding protein
MISVQNVRVAFDGKQVLHGISFEVGRGVIAGYVGPNGAGKTTTMRLLTGTLQPDAGRVQVAGIDLSGDSLEAKRRFGFVPEHGHLYDSFTPEEYLTFVARLYEIDDRIAGQRIASLLRYWKLEEETHQKMVGFSKGMRQKVLLSAALMHAPPVLLLDEPLSGLDAEAVLLVRALLRRWADRGHTVLYSSHILDAVEKVADQVIVIRGGKIIGDGSPQDLKDLTAAASLESAFSQMTATDDVAARTDALMEEAFVGATA